jgi:hypothetical protein
MNLKNIIGTFGLVPLVLLLLGIFWGSKWSKALLIIGAVYGLANLLWAQREVTAVVDVSGDPVITYPGAGL